MSYLEALRISFGGKFQSNVSTVNNDTGHYDSGKFKPNYQEMQEGHQMNGWFNPQGDAAFRLLGCHVTGAVLNGAATKDPVLGCIVADANSRVCAKMCDLDPQQQLVSEIWGLQVRIVDANGNLLLSGEFDVAAFMDIWDRATGGSGGGDMNAGAIYQSVLGRLQWGDVSSSPVLTALQEASASSGILSIKFNVDGVNANFQDPDFMCGRIVGTIGPATATEPRHLLLGRQFVAEAAPGGNFFTPVGKLNFFPGRLDSTASVLYLDLGNAISTASPAGPLNDLGNLVVAADGIALGVIPSQGDDGYAGDPTWYARTAGIVALPLSATQLGAARNSQIYISSATNPSVSIAESPTGAFVRADKFVYRMSPGDVVEIPVYATLFGQPLAGTTIGFSVDNDQLQGGSLCQPLDCPNPGTSATDPGPSFNGDAATDANGMAILRVQANDPGLARAFKDGSTIDGQVYGIRPVFIDKNYASPKELVNQWNFVSFLVWSSFAAPSPVTWETIQPILQQYANLYPIMLQFLDLGNPRSVLANARLLTLAFGLDPTNPNSMPVTRDLSPARRAAILSFLKEVQPGSDAEPPPPPPRPKAAMTQTPRAPELETLMSPRGGKTAALARRLVTRTQFKRPATKPMRIRKQSTAGRSPVDAVKVLLQQAVELEHSTLPPYLYALYSLDYTKNQQIANIIQSVVIEEMLHMTLASNVLNALGGSPVVDRPEFIPTYPGPLPGGVDAGLIVHLAPFSMDQLQTFIAIEHPADPLDFPTNALVETDEVTIGQFYEGIKQMIIALGDDAFVPGPRNQIGPDQMRHAVIVTNVATACKAIDTIVEQGEGTSETPKEVVGVQYAHYYRFMEIQKGRRLVRIAKTGPVEQQYAYIGNPIPFDSTGVFPVPSDPKQANYPEGSQERAFCQRFNYTYTALLRSLHATLNGSQDQLDTAIGVMMSLKGQARDMMSGIPNSAVFTGPSFEYQATDPSPLV